MHSAIIEFRSATPYPVQLANALAELAQVSLLLPHTFPTYRDVTVDPRVNFEIFHMPRVRYPTNLVMMYKLARRVKTLGVDMVHITAWYPWLIPTRFLFSPIPTISTIHDVHRHPGDAESWPLAKYLYHWQWHGASQIIVHATSAKEELVQEHHVAPERIHVIPIGAYSLYQAINEHGGKEQNHTVLFFGRIWAYKGLQHLIKAEPIISQAVPDVKIVIAGTGEAFEPYEALMVNREHFEVHNYRIPDEEVGRFFQSASVVALPYLEASQSGIIPLAYAFGKPVVATTVGGIPDVVDHGRTGYLVPPGDPQALADAIIKLLKNPQARHTMAQQALHKSQTVLSWPAVAKKTLCVYQHALGMIGNPT